MIPRKIPEQIIKEMANERPEKETEIARSQHDFIKDNTWQSNIISNFVRIIELVEQENVKVVYKDFSKAKVISYYCCGEDGEMYSRQ